MRSSWYKIYKNITDPNGNVIHPHAYICYDTHENWVNWFLGIIFENITDSKGNVINPHACFGDITHENWVKRYYYCRGRNIKYAGKRN